MKTNFTSFRVWIGKSKAKILILLLFLSGFCYVFAAPCGDVNSSGEIDIIDALMTAQFSVGLYPPGFDPASCDVNGDGICNIIDALMLAQYSVGLITILPGCMSSITWNPDRIERTIGNGTVNRPILVQFESDKDLTDAELEIDPQLTSFISIQSEILPVLEANTLYEFSLILLIPANAREGDYTGNLALSADGNAVPGLLPVTVTIDYGNIILSSDLKYLDETTLSELEYLAEDQTEIIFTNSTPVLDQLQAGDIIVASSMPEAIYGFYRKITSISRNDKVIINTAAAPLEEVIVQGNVRINEPVLGAPDVVPLQKAENAGLNDGTEYCFPFRSIVLYDHDSDKSTTDDQIRLNVTPCTGIGYIFDFDILQEVPNLLENGKIDYMKFLMYGSFSVEFEVEALLEKDFLDLGGEIPDFGLLPGIKVPIPVGGGVVLLFEIAPFFEAGIKGTLFAGFVAGVTSELRMELGFEYDDVNQFVPINSLTFNTEPLTIRPALGVAARAYIGVGLETAFIPIPFLPDIKLAIGPWISARYFLDFKADIFANPWWELYEGVSVQKGFQLNLDVYGFSFFNLVEWEEPFPYEITRLLACADGPLLTHDLRVSDVVIYPAPDNIYSGDTVSITPTITYDSPAIHLGLSVRVDYYVLNGFNEIYVSGTANVPLSAGGSGSFPITFVDQMSYWTRKLKIVIDPEDEVDETDEENNVFELTYMINS